MQEEIIRKALAGSLSEDERAALTPEDHLAIKAAAEKEASDALAKMGGLRQEKNRVEKLVEEKTAELAKLTSPPPAPPAAPAKDPGLEQFRGEQVQKARERFMSEFGIADADMVAYDSEFKRLDSGKMDAEFIFRDYKKTYAAIHSDDVIEAAREKRQQEANAAHEAAAAAGTVQAPPPGKEPSKFSDAALALAKRAGIPPESAERQLKEGNSRRLM